jgi:hypothetical protein
VLRHAITLEHLGRIDGGYAQADVADIPACGEILISEDYAHAGFLPAHKHELRRCYKTQIFRLHN